MKQLLIGNGAVARGLFEAGCVFVSSYPGTPSTEITEFAAKFPEIYCEWATNEKVAVEAAIGASLAGGRAFSAMKHVGLNVAADPVFTASYSGVTGGLVIAVADDPGMHSSQNEQDSRHYARAAKLPMLEPADSDECVAFTKLAFELSERFDTPVLLRLTTRIAHSQSLVEFGERAEIAVKPYTADPRKYVMAPANARARRIVVEKRENDLREWAETCAVNRVIGDGKKIGVIAAGDCYQYAREALGDAASYLKLGCVYPLPKKIITDFAASVETLYVIEEMDDITETFCKKNGITVIGKSAFARYGEITPEAIRTAILGDSAPACDTSELPVRPPVLCPGCPHRGPFYVLGKLKLNVIGDIGCYTLGASAPLNAMASTICMGASVGMAHGFSRVSDVKSVAVIGDSTFMHSGITGLLNTVYNGGISTVLILDNSITAMTGHQHNPASSSTLMGAAAPVLDFAKLCEALGVRRVRECDAFDLPGLETILREETAADEVSVVIIKRPCALLPSVERGKVPTIAATCVNCGLCMKLGCPAITRGDEGIAINASLCVGCGLCEEVCPVGGKCHE